MKHWQERLQTALPNRPELVGGDADRFTFSLDSINLYGGESIALQQAGVTAIVGANNAGKSTILRELWEKLSHQPGQAETPRMAVESLGLSVGGTPADAVAWVAENSTFVQRDSNIGFQRAQTGNVHPIYLTQAWQTQPIGEVGQLANFLVFYGNAQGRFGIGGAAEMRENVDDPPQHPVHGLQDSKLLLDEVSEISTKIFGKPLTLDVLGRTLRLRVGEVGLDSPPIDNVPQAYREKMAELRPLDEQGDGMRSLMGQLLPVVTASYKLLLIDEPEAFLHPPQAQALGTELGRIAAREGLQIIVATHDRGLLTGLLQSGVDVSVVRLARYDGPIHASRLDSNQLKTLWTDPVLKYTNVLDGLFHRMVVVAEAEGDCAFLAAALDCPGRTDDPLPRNEILFVPTGGKDGMAKVCRALSAVEVPVIAAPDLDMLSDKSKLAALVRSVGAEWSPELDGLWATATSDLNAPREPATAGHILDALSGVLEPRRGEVYSSELKGAVTAQLRTGSSPWNAVKDYGLSAFRGNARTAAKAMLSKLRDIGVVLVEQGELERLAPDIAVRKGPGWLQAALENGEQCNALTQAHIDRILEAGTSKLSGAA